MKKTLGRPKLKHPRKLMAFRFRPEYAKLLRKIAAREQKSQAKILEMSLEIFA